MSINSAIKKEELYAPKEPVRIGVIGCGAIAQGAHLPIIQDSESETLQAVCDIKPLLAKKVGQRYGALKVYTKIDDILNDQEIEAVIIALYHDDHPELAIEALRRGKHVLVEKPMAMKSVDAIRMVKEAKQSNRHLMVGYMWRYDRGTESSLQKLQSGSLGEVNFALAGGEEGIHGWEAGALRHIFHSDEKILKPIIRRPVWCNEPFVNFAYEFLMDCGSHTIDLLRMFLGEPKEICYTDVYRMDKTRDAFHPLRILSVLKFEKSTVYYNIAYLDYDITGMSIKMTRYIGIQHCREISPRESCITFFLVGISQRNLSNHPGVLKESMRVLYDA
jgi:predicted dehydrogenase